MDESGQPGLEAGTSHFVLVGIAIPSESWRDKDARLSEIKIRYGLENAELHAGWLSRRYLEQERIPGFGALPWPERRRSASEERKKSLLHVAATRPAKALQEAKKNLRKTEQFIHLTFDERRDLLRNIADEIASWSDCRLFGEAVDKRAYSGRPPVLPVFDAAFTQVVARFAQFLTNRSRGQGTDLRGLLVQDNNVDVARRMIDLMRRFHTQGTPWAPVDRITEVPLFVDSELTSMVQVADLCSYATRRFVENGETDLFDRIYSRFDRVGEAVVGLRHYTGRNRCECRICRGHGRN